MNRTIRKIRTVAFFATVAVALAQQTPQLDIIPYGGGTLGTVRFWNSGGAARKYAAWSGDAATATNCTHSISDVLILPCVAYQVGLGRSTRRFDTMYGRFIDLTSSATPTLAQLYVRRLASAGLISAVDDGTGQMVFTVSNGGVEKFYVDDIVARTGVGLRPTLASTGSLGTSAARFANTFTDNIRITTGFRLDATPTVGYVLTSDAVGNGTWQAAGGGTSPPFADNSPLIKNVIDPTKLVGFNVAGVTTATTRLLTVQDANYTIAGTNLAQTFTATQTFQNIAAAAAATYSIGASATPFTNTFSNFVTSTDVRVRDAGLTIRGQLHDTGGFGGEIYVNDAAGLNLFTANNTSILIGRDILTGTSYSRNIGSATDYFNIARARILALKSQSGVSTALFNITDSLGNLLFSQSDAGAAVGDFRIYDTGVAKFEVYAGNINLSTATINANGNLRITTVTPQADAIYNIGAAASRVRYVYALRGVFDQIYSSGLAGLSVTTAAGCVYTNGVLTTTC